MTTTQRHLGVVQIGKETTKGTAVAATAKLLCNSWETPLSPEIYYPEQMIGLLAEKHAGVQLNTAVEHTWETELTYEQILYALMMGVKGGVTPTGAGADKNWTFAPSAVGADDFNAFTIERRFTDGSTSYDREYPYTLAKSIEFSGGVDEIAKMKVEMFSQKEDSSTLTDSITFPSAWEPAVVNLAKVFIDTSWAGVGGTQIAGQVYSFSWKLTTGLERAWYMDGQYHFTRHRRTKREVEVSLRMDVGATSQALRALVTSRAARVVRIQFTGTTIDASNKTINLDCYGVVDPVGAEDERDGDDTIEIKLRSRYDAVGSLDFSVNVINALTALP